MATPKGECILQQTLVYFPDIPGNFILTIPMCPSWSSFNTLDWRERGISTQSPIIKHPWCIEILFLRTKYAFRSSCFTFLGYPVIVNSCTSLSKGSLRVFLFTSFLFTGKLSIRRIMYNSVESHSLSLCPCSGFTTGSLERAFAWQFFLVLLYGCHIAILISIMHILEASLPSSLGRLFQGGY